MADTKQTTVMIEKSDTEIANDICNAVEERIGHNYWPTHNFCRADLFNIVASRIAMERLKGSASE